jgi:hypothetical protein
MKHNFPSWITFIFVIIISSIALPAAAYVGPGAGLSAIGSLIALIGAIVVAILGFLWYPIKRLMRKKQKPTKADEIEN